MEVTSTQEVPTGKTLVSQLRVPAVGCRITIETSCTEAGLKEPPAAKLYKFVAVAGGLSLLQGEAGVQCVPEIYVPNLSLSKAKLTAPIAA